MIHQYISMFQRGRKRSGRGSGGRRKEEGRKRRKRKKEKTWWRKRKRKKRRGNVPIGDAQVTT